MLIVALAAAVAVGAAVRARAGKVRAFSRTDSADSSGTSHSAARPIRSLATGRASGGSGGRPPGRLLLTADDLGASLGDRATLVQFSTEFCAYCGPTRTLLGEIAGEHRGVALVEIDAAERMDLTRRLRVLSTPTVFVLGPDGTVTARSSGKPRKAELMESVRSVLDDGGPVLSGPGGDRNVAGE